MPFQNDHKISYNPDIPLHHQIQQLLRARIANKEWGFGEQIPTEAALRNAFGVSRTTIRQALTPLVHEGLLKRHRSKGTFVNRQSQPDKRRAVTVANQILGYRAKTDLVAIDTVSTPNDIAELLRIGRGGPIRKFIRVELLGKERVAVVLNFVPIPIAEKIRKSDLRRCTMIECLRERAGLRADRTEISIQASMPNEEVAGHLRYELGQPVLFLRMVVYDMSGTAIQVADSYFRGDRVRFEHVLHGNKPHRTKKDSSSVGKIAVSRAHE